MKRYNRGMLERTSELRRDQYGGARQSGTRETNLSGVFFRQVMRQTSHRVHIARGSRSSVFINICGHPCRQSGFSLLRLPRHKILQWRLYLKQDLLRAIFPYANSCRGICFHKGCSTAVIDGALLSYFCVLLKTRSLPLN